MSETKSEVVVLSSEKLNAAAPEMLEALSAILNEEVLFSWVLEKGIGAKEYARRSKLLNDARAAISRATR